MSDMVQVRRDTNLVEQVVSQAEQVIEDMAPLRRKPRVQQLPSKSSDVVHIVVHPMVWSEAIRLCGDEPRRIQVISESEVVVHNKPRRKR